MGTTKRRSPTSTLVSKSAISQASSILEELPEKPKEIWSLREAIELLQDPITAALDRGYTYPEVSKMLSERGVEISPSTLKYYLSSARREKDPNKPRTRRQRRTLLPPADAASTTVNGTAAVAESVESEVEAPAPAPKAKRGAASEDAAAAPAAARGGRRTTAAKAKTEPAAAKSKTTRTTRAKAATTSSKGTTSRARKKTS
jgi:hypothetical protein